MDEIQPIFNPLIPCVYPLPWGVYPGFMLRVQGHTPDNAKRFAINLQTGPKTDPRDDIALHLNFRFDKKLLVRNHLQQLQWGKEEITGALPLRAGSDFEVIVLCEQRDISIALDGQHFCEFVHRIPFQKIKFLTMDGDVSVAFIAFEGDPPPQHAFPGYGKSDPPPPYNFDPNSYNPNPSSFNPNAIGFNPNPNQFNPNPNQFNPNPNQFNPNPNQFYPNPPNYNPNPPNYNPNPPSYNPNPNNYNPGFNPNNF